MTFILPELPYEKNALEPFVSEETLNYHYGKHHAAYVNKLNELLENSNFQGKTLEEIITSSKGVIFNNAAQIWNHNMIWHCMTPEKNQKPSPKLFEAITDKFGSVENLLGELKAHALSNFGSGWTWLTKDSQGNLKIVNTDDAYNTLTSEDKALLVIDVWEHAYYIDTRNDRGKYVDNFFQVLNWDYASANFNKD